MYNKPNTKKYLISQKDSMGICGQLAGKKQKCDDQKPN